MLIRIRDFPSGDVLYSVPAPPNFVDSYFEYNQIPQVFEDRLLVPGRQGSNSHNVVFVYSVTDGPGGPVNQPPTDIALSNISVPENSANGTVVGALSATDPDSPETVAFSLLDNSGGRFAINGDQLIVNNGSLLNFEQNSSLNINVQVTDSAGNIYSEVLTIQVTNVNEPPTSIGLNNDQVLENALGGAVGVLISNDPDNPDAQSFELLDNAGGRFGLVGSIITVLNGSLLDFETNTSHTITVRVTDSVGHQFTGPVTINVVNVNESPTDIATSNTIVTESTVRVIHGLSAEATAFGRELAAAGDYILASEQFGLFPATQRRVQVIHATTGVQLQTLTAPVLNPTASVPDGRFGGSFTISGNRAFIGASSTKVGNFDEAGAVYVFDIASGNLLFTLNSPTPTATGFFGATLAISANVLAVSATNEATGTIYLFNATTGQLLESVANPTPAPLEAFGQSLALSGNTLVTSSRFEDVGATDAGVAYIYEFNPATSIATLTHTLNNPTPASNERFGASVAVAGSLVAVSDLAAVAGDTNVGSVHLFDRLTGAFLRTIANPESGATDLFGSELFFSGDFVIASSGSDLGGFNNGRAYVFRASTGLLFATILNPSPAASDEFAFRLAVTAGRIVASAVGDDTDGSNRGLVYFFDLPIGQQVGMLSTTDPDAGETFTYSLSDNADGRFAINGNNLVIADATKLDFESATTHSVTVVVTDSGGNQHTEVLPITVTAVNEPPQDTQLSNSSVTQGQVRFLHHPSVNKEFGIGYVTAADGDLVVAGSNNLTNNVGEVYVFNAGTGDLVSTLTSPAPQSSEVFGEHVAISGNRVVVSARLKDIGTIANVGQAYVFNATTGSLLYTLNLPTPLLNGSFGTDVGIDNDLVAVASSNRVFLFTHLPVTFCTRLRSWVLYCQLQ